MLLILITCFIIVILLLQLKFSLDKNNINKNNKNKILYKKDFYLPNRKICSKSYILPINRKIYTNIYNLTPFQSTTLSTNYNRQNYLYNYPKNISQKPWYKPWTNGKNQFLCYLDPHLNRKCIWTCPNKSA